MRKNTGIPQIGSRVPMYPNAGDVQAPAPSATPGGGKKSHVYREEWEMDEGAYGSKGTPRVNPYSEFFLIFCVCFWVWVVYVFFLYSVVCFCLFISS